MREAGAYDSDRWTRRWAVTTGAGLFGALLVPIWLPRGPSSWGWVWAWDLSPDPLGLWLAVYAPHAAGLTLLLTALLLRGRARARGVVAAGLGLLAAWIVALALGFRGDWATAFGSTGIAVGVACAAVAAAAGNHLRRRYPASEFARRATGVAGLALALLGLAAGTGFWFAVSRAVATGLDGVFLVLLVVSAYACAYGVVSALHGRDGGDVAFRSSLLAWMGRLFLVLAPGSLAVAQRLAVTSLVPSSLGTASQGLAYGTHVAHEVLLNGGEMMLGALTACVWLEPRVRARHGPVDPQVAERVFA